MLLESDVMKQWENWLLVAYVFNVEMFMGNALLWKQGHRSFKVDRNKLFASNEKQTYNHTLMLDMLHSNMSVVCTYHCRGAFHETFFERLLFFVDLCSQKSWWRHWPSIFMYARHPPRWVLMFTRHLHSPQLCIQAILCSYIYKTDYMMSLTLYTLTSVCIFSILFSIHFLMCWQGEFV